MIEAFTLESDGQVTVVLDFTKHHPPQLLSALFASPRATTSSKAPGQKNKGTIYVERPVLEPCARCGRMRRSTTRGVHAPHHAVEPDQVVDCVGRRCELVEGYFRTVEGDE